MREKKIFFFGCFTSPEARWPIRDGERVGRGRQSERLDRGNRPKKTGETVDRRQNNGSVKAVSPRHCPATCALRNCCFNCCPWAVTKTMSVAPLLTNNLDNSSKGSPAFLAQLHLPTHDLFWAKLRVQLHLPPLRSLDLLISPGTLKKERKKDAPQWHIYSLSQAHSVTQVCTGITQNQFLFNFLYDHASLVLVTNLKQNEAQSARA